MSVRNVSWRLFVDWDFDGTYTEESTHLVSANGSMRLTPPGESITASRGQVDRATLILRNPAGRFSSLLTTGALYSDLQDGGAYHAPMYLEVQIGTAGYERIFTGVVKLPQESSPSAAAIGQIALDCRSRDEEILNARASTTLAKFVQIADEGWTEEEILEEWLQNAGLTDGTDFTSQAQAGTAGTATLDPGMWIIPWAWLDDESPIADGWELASAVGGRLYTDPEGVYRYENAQHWLLSPHNASQGTVSRSDFDTLTAYYNDRELFNAATVEFSPRAKTDEGTIWEAEQVHQILPGETKTITARLRQPAYSIASVAYTAITTGGLDITSSVSVSTTQYAQRVELEITNNHASHAALMIALTLQGVAVEGSPSGEESLASADAFWTNRKGRERSIRSKVYVQTEAQAGFLAEFLRDRQELPRLFFAAANAPGEPSRRLGDRLTLSDDKLMSADRDGYLVGVSWRLGEFGFRQDLELVDAASLYPFQDADPDYFIIGQDRLGGTATSSSPGRMFY